MAKKKKTERKRYITRPKRNTRARASNIWRIVISVVIILAVIGTIAFLLMRNQSEITVAENAVGSLLTPVQNVLSTAATKVKNFVTTWRNYDELQDQYDELVQENMQLSLELDAAQEDILENERLLELLDAAETYESLDPVYAKVIAREAGQWFTTFTINKGELSGVSAGMAVVNGDGLIGRVYEAGLNYAKVVTIISTDSKLSCLIQSTRENGILNGGVTDDSDEAVCYVYYLPSVNNIVPGDVVVTSGTDSVYPKGLTIGTVTEISLDAGSEGTYAVVTPAVDFQRIEEVLVLRDEVETADEDDTLSALPTATPTVTATPTPAPDSDEEAEETVSPDSTEDIWYYPTATVDASATEEAEENTTLELLPEDEWAED